MARDLEVHATACTCGQLPTTAGSNAKTKQGAPLPSTCPAPLPPGWEHPRTAPCTVCPHTPGAEVVARDGGRPHHLRMLRAMAGRVAAPQQRVTRPGVVLNRSRKSQKKKTAIFAIFSFLTHFRNPCGGWFGRLR